MLTKPALSYASGVSDVPLLGETIGVNFERTVARHGDREALVDCATRRRWTYSELDVEVDEVALGLMALGVRTGDRVGLLAPSCAEWVLVQYASAKIGAVLVGVDPAHGPSELRHVLRGSGLSVLVHAGAAGTDDHRGVLAQLQGGCPDLRHVVHVGEASWRELVETGSRADHRLLDERMAALSFDDPVAIQYAVGTTGVPKGATMSHHSILNNGFFAGELIGLSEGDRVCLPVAFHHCFASVAGSLAATSHGACTVLPAASFDPAATLAAVREERCTALYGTPAMFVAALGHPDVASADLSTLRTAVVGGGPCPPEVVERVLAEMGAARVAIGFGTAETSSVSTMTTLSDDDPPGRTSGAGRVMPHLEVKVVDAVTGREVERGRSGELCTRGYSVMLGYWDEPGSTAEVIDAARWMHTGHRGVMDADGYVTVSVLEHEGPVGDL